MGAWGSVFSLGDTRYPKWLLFEVHGARAKHRLYEGCLGKTSAINAFVCPITWLDTFSTALVIFKCEKAGTEIHHQLREVYREDALRVRYRQTIRSNRIA